jgi:hypothetical protein
MELIARATSGTLPQTTHQARRHQQQFILANQSGKSKKNKSRRYKRKLHKPFSNHGYEGLLSLMQSILRRMDNKNKTCKPPSACQICLHCIDYHAISYSYLAFYLRNHLFYPHIFYCCLEKLLHIFFLG